MSQHQRDEMDHVADDYEMAEVDDDMYFRGRVIGDSESDDEDEYDHLVRSFPTSNSIDYNCFSFPPKYCTCLFACFHSFSPHAFPYQNIEGNLLSASVRFSSFPFPFPFPCAGQ